MGAAISSGHHIWDHAAGVALVRAAGGVVTDLHGAPWTATSTAALAAAPECMRRSWRSCTGSVHRRSTADGCRRSRDSLPGRRCRPSGQGVNFENLRDAGDPVELAAAYDAQGADELTFLDVTASSSGRATMLEVVRRTAEQVFIPLTVGGGCDRSTTSTRCFGPARTRCRLIPPRSPSGAAGRAVTAVRFAVHRAVGGRPDRAAGGAPTASGWEVTTHGVGRGPVSTPSTGQCAGPSSVSVRSCSIPWTPTAPRQVRPADASCGACRGQCAGDRQRRCGERWAISRRRCRPVPMPCSRPACSTSAS